MVNKAPKGTSGLFWLAFRHRARNPYVISCMIFAGLFGLLMIPFVSPAGATLVQSILALILIGSIWTALYIACVVYADYRLRHIRYSLRGFITLLPGSLLAGLIATVVSSWIFNIPIELDNLLHMTAIVLALAFFTRGSEMADYTIVMDNPTLQNSPFLRRLSKLGRERLVHIEAQDHYLRVETETGSEMVRLRLSDAIEELSNYPGAQVHRSHWVALDMVKNCTTVKNGMMLTLRNGKTVPVSQPNRAYIQDLAKEMGWKPIQKPESPPESRRDP